MTTHVICSRCGKPMRPVVSDGTDAPTQGFCFCPPPVGWGHYTLAPVDWRDAELARLRAELEQNKAATERALELAVQYGGIDGDHHKAWVIDQMVRALLVTEPVYAQFVKDACDGEDGPDTYAWDTGVIP